MARAGERRWIRDLRRWLALVARVEAIEKKLEGK
jgi:hypothetical protein